VMVWWCVPFVLVRKMLCRPINKGRRRKKRHIHSEKPTKFLLCKVVLVVVVLYTLWHWYKHKALDYYSSLLSLSHNWTRTTQENTIINQKSGTDHHFHSKYWHHGIIIIVMIIIVIHTTETPRNNPKRPPLWRNNGIIITTMVKK